MICRICNKECKSISKHLFHAHKMDVSQKESYFDKYIEPNDSHLCICGNKRKFYKFYYLPTCGNKECVIKQRSITCENRYGCKCGAGGINIIKSLSTKLIHYGNTSGNVEKRSETFIKKYGNKSPLAVPELRQKGYQTKLAKYGSPTYNNRAKAEQTCLSTYGVRHHFQNHEIYLKTVHKIHKYGQCFDSQWEVDYYEYLIKSNKKFVYHPKCDMFFEFEGKIHKYYPDFLVEGTYVEIKGDHLFKKMQIVGTYDHEKYLCMLRNNVKILTEKDMVKIWQL